LFNKLILQEFNNYSPVGEDCKYEDSFLLIEQEIDKNNSVTQIGNTDWKLIINKCEEFLVNESKDLKISSWWLYGLWKEDSWSGLKDGLYTYIELLKRYKKDLFPKSKKAKTNIFSWISESLSEDFINSEALQNSIIDEEEINNLLKNLDLIIKEILENDDNNFRKITRHIDKNIEEKNNKIPNKIVIKKEEITKITPELVKEPEVNKVIKEEITEIHTDADAIKVLRTFKKNANLLTTYYRNKNISDLKAIRINRMLSWLDTEGLPYEDNKKTSLNPPSELELDDVKNLFKNKEFEDAFILVEEILEMSPFWIDGHHYAFMILEKTKNYAAANEVKNTLVSFIKSNEGILDLYFIDDMPFASNKVKNWIDNEMSSSNQVLKVEVKSTDDEKDLVTEIYELANNDNLPLAMQELQKNYDISTNVEDKFNWRLTHAHLAIEFNKSEIALALLESLEQDINKFCLEEWNPKLASRVYSMILSSFNNTDIDTQKIESIYKKLCKIDINSALQIKIN
jgi:type VI secretion system protein VasJ